MLTRINEVRNQIKENVQKVIVGKDEAIDLLLVAMFCSGHVLLEDVPGLGKTVLAKALSKSINADYSRIQFTPDLLPSDITGINYFNQKSGEFEFKAGPLMTQILLADEINRATPRTQASLLEVMSEQQVTIDGKTHQMKTPFFVIATQNPVEQSGTFPLPEAQLDRFFMKLSLGYPDFNEESEILKRFKTENPLNTLEAVMNSSEIEKMMSIFETITVADEIVDYIVKLTQQTRQHESVELGISPRGSMALFQASQVYAALEGRDYVIPDDVKALVKPIFRHRIILDGRAEMTGVTSDQLIDEIVSSQQVPVEDFN
jgi:MoxR-like ATPase